MNVIRENPLSIYRDWTPPFSPRLLVEERDIKAVSRPIRMIVVHCSATRSVQSYSPEQLEQDHLRRGFRGCGYHYYIMRSGWLYEMRPPELVGAHARGYNRYSIGVCYEGGLDARYQPADTRTPEQRQMLEQLMQRLRSLYPTAFILGHRDLSPDLNGDGVISPHEWTKACPCFDARQYNQ